MANMTRYLQRFFASAVLAGFAVAASMSLAPTLRAQDSAVVLDRGLAKIEFTLGSTLHTVHGTFALKNSTLRFDPAGRKLSGTVVVDATTGESGNSGRDSRMHREILESVKFPEIVFTPTQITGAVAAQGTSNVEVSGRLLLHGREHDLKVPVEIVADGQRLQLALHFVIPYVEWGLKNPSNFLLHVSDKVEVDVHADGRMETATALQ
jgi:polyisoprenoid-binding protein YceI